MREFFITIKNDGKVLGNFDKIAFNLDTEEDIVKQADETVLSLLDSLRIEEKNRKNISWKAYQFKENEFRMVTKTRNWVET